MMRRLALVVLMLCASGVANAQARKVLIFPVSGGDEITAGKLTTVLARTAGLLGAEVTVGSASFDDTALLAGCAGTGADCMSPVAASLGVDELVLANIETNETDRLVLSVQVYRDEALTSHTVTLTGNMDAMVTQLAREASPIFLGEGPKKPVEEAPPPVVPPPVVVVAPPPPAPPERESSFGNVSTVWWITAAAGVVIAGTGGYFLLEASRLQDEVNTAPTDSVADLDRLAALEEDGQRNQTLGTWLTIGGAAVAVGAGAMILWQGLTPHERTVTVGAVPLRGGAAVTLEVRLP